MEFHVFYLECLPEPGATSGLKFGAELFLDLTQNFLARNVAPDLAPNVDHSSGFRTSVMRRILS